MPQRRTTIDAIRGFCLINIFVNHIHNGYVSSLSPSRLGFSDSAEIFVLLSGISTALATRQMSHRPFGALVAPLWRRAARLYAFDLIIVLTTLGVLATILALRGVTGAHAPETRLLRDHDVPTVLWHTLSLGQAVGYSFVLRLYIALMLFAPVLLRLAHWRLWAPLPPVLVLWALAGHFAWVVPNSLSGAPLHLTILPWTLLFTIGIVIGQASNLGITLPRSRPLTVVALGSLAAYLVLVLWSVHVWPAARDWASTRGDHFWLGASKTYQSPLRILHVLALAYVVVAMPAAPVIRLLHAVPRDHALARLGRRSLPVFTAGAIVAVPVSEVLDLAAHPLGGAWFPLLLIEVAAIGLFVVLALRVEERSRRTGGRPWTRTGADGPRVTPAESDRRRPVAAPVAGLRS